MAIVNSISIENSKFIKSCEDFANVFTNQIIEESQRFSEIRIIFDLYLDISFKIKQGMTEQTVLKFNIN